MRRGLVLCAGALVAALATVAVACGDGSDSPAAAERSSSADPTERFLDRYVTDEGRVVRRDQGGDTVSEGQAYALLLAVAARDERTFRRVWRWTETNLQRSDGALSWHWEDGEVVDPQPATDADVDAARALKIAAGRFDEPRFARESRRLERAIRRTMVDDGILLAGPWAQDERWENPSYLSPRAARTLGLDAASADRLPKLLDGHVLPADWTRGGEPSSHPGDDGEGRPRYGYDAVRVPVRLAESCRREDRRMAARMWPVLREDSGRLPRSLDGAPLEDADRTAVALVGAAAAAHAAGAESDARELLELAAERDREHPSYYGAAWIALATEMLVRERLGHC